MHNSFGYCYQFSFSCPLATGSKKYAGCPLLPAQIRNNYRRFRFLLLNVFNIVKLPSNDVFATDIILIFSTLIQILKLRFRLFDIGFELRSEVFNER